MLVVREKLVLQVADEQFQNIVYRGFKKIQAASYNPDHAFNEDAYTFEAVPEPDWAAREYDDNALLDRIFKDFSFDFDALGTAQSCRRVFLAGRLGKRTHRGYRSARLQPNQQRGRPDRPHRQ